MIDHWLKFAAERRARTLIEFNQRPIVKKKTFLPDQPVISRQQILRETPHLASRQKQFACARRRGKISRKKQSSLVPGGL